MQTDLRECYRILDVEPGAPLDEVKRSYRELVKVWHPDRFAHDPNLQRKVQEKLKQINSAYERICAGGPMPQSSGSSNPRSCGTAARSDPPPPPPPSPPPPRPAPAPAKESNWKLSFVPLAIIVGIAVLKPVFSTKDNSPPRSGENQPSDSEPRPTYQVPQPSSAVAQPKVRQHLGIAQISATYQEALEKQPGLGMTLQEFSRYAQEKLPDYDFSEGINYAPPKDTPSANTETSVSAVTAAQEQTTERLLKLA